MDDNRGNEWCLLHQLQQNRERFMNISSKGGDDHPNAELTGCWVM